MNTKRILKNTDTDYISILLLCLCVTAVFFVAWTFTGQWPWKSQAYNSYILQAQSWLEGRLDLGRDYPYLELAIFNNKYYVSFPPFPSYVMLPFVLVGWDSCDSIIAFAVSLLGAVYAFKILKHFDIESKTAIFFTLLLTVGSNWLMTAQNAWVWFSRSKYGFYIKSYGNILCFEKQNRSFTCILGMCGRLQTVPNIISACTSISDIQRTQSSQSRR